MIIEVYWDEDKIMDIEKNSNFFYTSIYKTAINRARIKGFPLFFLKDIKVISKEVPYFIKRRIYNLSRKCKEYEDFSNGSIQKDNPVKVPIELNSPIDKLKLKIEM